MQYYENIIQRIEKRWNETFPVDKITIDRNIITYSKERNRIFCGFRGATKNSNFIIISNDEGIIMGWDKNPSKERLINPFLDFRPFG